MQTETIKEQLNMPTTKLLKQKSMRGFFENLIRLGLLLCAALSILTSIAIVAVLLTDTIQFFKIVSIWEFLTSKQWTPLFADKHFGILPLLSGTLLTSLIAMLIALPLGMLIAIYLSEFAHPASRKIFKPILELLSGIPTIVYGYFALVTVTPLLQTIFPSLSAFNALSAGLVMGFMILPMVASLSEDALYVLPQSLRDASNALGASRMQTVFKVLIPAALGGIMSAFILALSRATGETMIVAIAAGQQPTLTLNPFDPVTTMTAYIVQISLGDIPHGTVEYFTVSAVAAMLFLLTLLMNFISLKIRERFKNAYT